MIRQVQDSGPLEGDRDLPLDYFHSTLPLKASPSVR